MSFSSAYISVKNTFVGVHKWSKCSISSVAFLQNSHRHVFHVKTCLPVYHDRELEFFTVQTEIDYIIGDLYGGGEPYFILGDRSCEMVAKEIIKSYLKSHPQIDWIRVEVSEDDENSAGVIWEK